MGARSDSHGIGENPEGKGAVIVRLDGHRQMTAPLAPPAKEAHNSRYACPRAAGVVRWSVKRQECSHVPAP